MIALLLFVALAGAGEPSSLPDPLPLVAQLKSSRPAWTFAKRETAGASVVYDFASSGQHLFLTLTPLATPEAAKAHFERRSAVRTVPPTEAPAIGEACRVWATGEAGPTSLLLWSGKTVVEINAPSKDEALQLARSLDGSLRPKR